MSHKEITDFPTEVHEKIKFYVYRLIDPRNGETFYVGKGKGNRMFRHMQCAFTPSEEDDDETTKIRTIREISAAGLDVIHVVHRHGMEEDVALQVEAALIDAYPGATNLVAGTGSGEFGPMNALEIVNTYAAAEAIFAHRILMITVNRTLLERSIYDATRFAWRLDKGKAERAEYVLAVRQGMIIRVFEASEWKEALIDNFPEFGLDRPGRYGFVGSDAADRTDYLHKRVPEEYRRKGSQNPVRYTF